MITVIENQSLLDVAVQIHGSALTAFELAIKNGFSITDDLLPGQQLIAPVSEFDNVDVAEYFKGKNQLIATKFNDALLEELKPKIGIEKMIIGSTFIVG